MMRVERIKELLEKVKSGEIDIETALDTLKGLPYKDLDFAKIDTHRTLRRGFPEVIFCEGKSQEQLKKIIARLSEIDDFIMATRADETDYKAIKEVINDAEYHKDARIVTVGEFKKEETDGLVVVLCAGTSDIPVAEEAYITAKFMGNKVRKIYDVGVAGLHRLFDEMDVIQGARVIVAVAGMEGALPSIVSGLVASPVIAVPTSIGYGANFRGLSALLTMLNTCSPGVSVVNIDNGFGAGYMAGLINRIGDSE
jgi:hypothetical protein